MKTYLTVGGAKCEIVQAPNGRSLARSRYLVLSALISASYTMDSEDQMTMMSEKSGTVTKSNLKENSSLAPVFFLSSSFFFVLAVV